MRTEILNALFAKLSSIESIKEVYKFTAGNFTNYPVALIVGSENVSERESTNHIKKTYTFKVRILQEVNEEARGKEDGEDIINQVFDDIDDAIDTDDTLGGSCDDVNIRSVFAWEDRELLMRAVDIDITCVKLKQF